MHRLIVMACLIAGTGIVAAQGPGEFLPPDETGCWNCHGPGRDDPHMDPSFKVYLQHGQVGQGEVTTLRFELLNVWLGEVLDATATLDLAGTGLEVAGEPVPVQRETLRSEVPMQTPASALAPREATAWATVPDGSTAIRIALVPDDRSGTGPDLSLAVAPERSNRTYVRDEAGAGGKEVLRLRDLDDVVAAGYGNWTFHVRAAADDPHLLPAPFAIEISAWTNSTGQTRTVLTATGPLQPGAKASMSAPVQMVAAPEPGAQIRLVANATYFWQHTGCTTCDDHGYFHVPFTFLVTSTDGDASFGTDSGTVAPVVQGVSLARISEAIGYLAGTLLLVSFVTGGVLGKKSRRRLNVIFGSARRRVAYHNFVSYGLIMAAVAHLVIFIVEVDWHWAHGLMWGGASLLAMLGLGVTGAMQVPLIRRWNYAAWRRIHLGLAITALATAAAHMLLDGANFAWVQEALGYQDPFVPDA